MSVNDYPVPFYDYTVPFCAVKALDGSYRLKYRGQDKLINGFYYNNVWHDLKFRTRQQARECVYSIASNSNLAACKAINYSLKYQSPIDIEYVNTILKIVSKFGNVEPAWNPSS